MLSTLRKDPPADHEATRPAAPTVFPQAEAKADVANPDLDRYPVLRHYRTIEMRCPRCERRYVFPVPVDLRGQRCLGCNVALDPMGLGADGLPVNHLLMQKLIATCYQHRDAAQTIIKQYRRDYDHAKAEDWGIDKDLLALHAASALLLRGHRSWVTLVGLALATGAALWSQEALLLFSLPLLWICFPAPAGQLHRERWIRCDGYDPTRLPERVRKEPDALRKLLHFVEVVRPKNLLFFSQHGPFQQTGNEDSSWSMLVDRRKQKGGEIQENPLHLNLAEAHELIEQRVCGSDGPGVYSSRFTVEDVALMSGYQADPTDERFFVTDYMIGAQPRAGIDAPILDELRESDHDTCRVYRRITLYQPHLDIGMTTFLRLQHQGPFTFIEVVGTRILPVLQFLFGKYKHTLSAAERIDREVGSKWWVSISYPSRTRFLKVLGLAVLSVVLWLLCQAGGEEIAPLAGQAQVALLAIVVAATYGIRSRIEDLYSPRERSVLESVVLFFTTVGLYLYHDYRHEKARQQALKRIRIKKECQEFDFSPSKWGLRYWQGRTELKNYFERTNLQLWRATHDQAIQEAFLECLERASIDTSEFREGTAQINNYGIINSGQIAGDAKAAHSNGTRAGSRRRQADRQKRQSAPALSQ